MNNLHFAHPGYFYLLFILLPMIAWYIFKLRDGQATLQISSLKGFAGLSDGYKIYFRHILFVLRILLVTVLIAIIARPQTVKTWENEITEGIDIVLALDISGSMLAEDFIPNRLEASKEVAAEFVAGRPNDRMGLVVFSGESFTQCPLTSDHAVLSNLINQMKQGMIEDGTAIGLGLANAVARLKDSKSKSKVVILLTDGVNNMGNVAPLTAADIATSFGIRVYTIGVGKNGFAPYPVQTMWGTQMQQMEVQIDENVLREIAAKTNGKYFRATDNQKLKEIYAEIDKLEKTKVEVEKFSKANSEIIPFALAAAFLLLLEILLRNTWLRNIP